nr:MAG TPA: hypothetical protein [Caudoviricetes sp.]
MIPQDKLIKYATLFLELGIDNHGWKYHHIRSRSNDTSRQIDKVCNPFS